VMGDESNVAVLGYHNGDCVARAIDQPVRRAMPRARGIRCFDNRPFRLEIERPMDLRHVVLAENLASEADQAKVLTWALKIRAS
jgi:hypothetical protein